MEYHFRVICDGAMKESDSRPGGLTKGFMCVGIPYLVPPEREANAAIASPVGICLLCRPSLINNVFSWIFHENVGSTIRNVLYFFHCSVFIACTRNESLSQYWTMIKPHRLGEQHPCNYTYH